MYFSESSINWLIKNTFSFCILNKSLRDQNIYLCFLLQFFVRDLQTKLQMNYSINELDILQQFEWKLISINSFLSTNMNPNIPHMFEISAGPYRSWMKSFTNIESFNQYLQENKVLVMLSSVFCLNKIY